MVHHISATVAIAKVG